MRVVLLIVVLATLGGLTGACTTVQTAWHDAREGSENLGLIPRAGIQRRHHWVVPADSRFFVVASSVGTAEPMARALKHHFAVVDLDTAEMSLDHAKTAARVQKADYLLYLDEHSRGHVHVTMVHAIRGDILDTASLRVDPGLLKFYNNNPVPALDRAMLQFADSLTANRAISRR